MRMEIGWLRRENAAKAAADNYPRDFDDSGHSTGFSAKDHDGP